MTQTPDTYSSTQALDSELNLFQSIPQALQQIEQYQKSSQAILEHEQFTTVQYGDSPLHSFIEITPSGYKKGNGIAVFVHGGYWRAYGAKDFLSAVSVFLDMNKKLISIDYPLAPAARMGDIVQSVGKAFKAISTRYPEEAIWAVGHSAGAHLVASCCQQLNEPEGGPDRRIERAYLISGLYDLRPVRQSFLQETLHLDEHESVACSPLLQTPNANVEYWLLHGSMETAIFQKQSEHYLRHLRGKACSAHLIAIAADHFSILGSNWLAQAHASTKN